MRNERSTAYGNRTAASTTFYELPRFVAVILTSLCYITSRLELGLLGTTATQLLVYIIVSTMKASPGSELRVEAQ
jgi:hypothetical protein